MSLPSGILLGIENPLLDISGNVTQAFLDKYHLKGGNAKLAEPADMPLYDDLIKNHGPVEYIAGGSAQNSMRAFAYMTQQKNVSKYIGCVGKDENAKILRNSAQHDGVAVHYLEDPETPTGTCAVCIVKKERSLVANLAAANKYKKAHFDSDEVQGYVKDAKFFYSTGYFLTVSPDTALALGKYAAANNKTLAFNLAAPFVMEVFADPFDALVPYIDVLFGNETEAAALAKKRGWNTTDCKIIAAKAAELPKENKSRPRLVVITQGADPAVAAINGHVFEFAAKHISKDLIVDTNGAGDSFVGGFLSRYVQGRELAECVAAGHWCASQVIQVSGCQFPFKMTFEWHPQGHQHDFANGHGPHSHGPHGHGPHPHGGHCQRNKVRAVIGKPAPNFSLGAVRNGEVTTVKLSDFKGKYLVLFFYPLDFTFVCPTEIIAFADRAAEFRKINTEIAAVSVDSVFTHLAWTKTPRKSGGLGAVDIPLLSDLNKKTATEYGVLITDGDDAGVSFRGLFIISPTGVLRQITINDLPVGRSVDETLRLVQAFQFTDEHGEVCPANWTPGAATMKPSPKESLAYFSKQN